MKGSNDRSRLYSLRQILQDACTIAAEQAHLGLEEESLWEEERKWEEQQQKEQEDPIDPLKMDWGPGPDLDRWVQAKDIANALRIKVYTPFPSTLVEDALRHWEFPLNPNVWRQPALLRYVRYYLTNYPELWRTMSRQELAEDILPTLRDRVDDVVSGKLLEWQEQHWAEIVRLRKRRQVTEETP